MAHRSDQHCSKFWPGETKCLKLWLVKITALSQCVVVDMLPSVLLNRSLTTGNYDAMKTKTIQLNISGSVK